MPTHAIHHSPHATSRPAADPRWDDLMRVALLLAITLVVALSIMLVARNADAPLTGAGTDALVWHGNVAASRAE